MTDQFIELLRNSETEAEQLVASVGTDGARAIAKAAFQSNLALGKALYQLAGSTGSISAAIAAADYNELALAYLYQFLGDKWESAPGQYLTTHTGELRKSFIRAFVENNDWARYCQEAAPEPPAAYTPPPARLQATAAAHEPQQETDTTAPQQPAPAPAPAPQPQQQAPAPMTYPPHVPPPAPMPYMTARPMLTPYAPAPIPAPAVPPPAPPAGR